ncbi:hypothetical protein [Actinoallomurus sp. NPDC050550]|uniref:hypothetical protein n=1 Tax=Actinoallomurus sp. NPDC050550 TaxID=3154937 RepID=UPI00340DDF74
MRKLALLGTTLAAGALLTTLGATGAQASPITAQSSSYVKCGKSNVHFTWKEGWSSTKIYFNNHCTKGKLIRAAVVSRNYRVDHYQYWCRPLDTHGGTKGNKKFGSPDDGYHVWKVLAGHKNKYCKVH